MTHDGASDVARAVEVLAGRLPESLRPLARVAYDYRWAWTLDGPEVFRSIDPYRYELSHGNPVRVLLEAAPERIEQAARDHDLVGRIDALTAAVAADADRPPSEELGLGGPVAFLCAEFGIHMSMPIYSGGLGVLAGDILKEASDRALPMVGVGIMYRRGYFHQRVDLSGWQHEYWIETDPERLPAVRVTTGDGHPLVVHVPIWARDVEAEVWRVDVGRVPLYLLDTELPQNRPVERWITARLYEGNRAMRLAQYALLGIGGIRALRAMGIEPSVLHLNEGHPAMAALELSAERVAAGANFADAFSEVRERFVFTTHTPVAAGNETYGADEILSVMPDLPERLGIDDQTFLGLGRVHPADGDEPSGMTPLAIRASRSTNGVSRRHGEVARAMWQPLHPDLEVDAVPIRHVTNGVHLPTFMAPPMRRLLDRYLGDGWMRRAADPRTWEPVREIPDGELWAVRTELRHALVEFVRTRSVTDRLERGEQIDYVQAAATTFEPDRLTIGFARRIAAYKRLHLLSLDPGRALRLIDGEAPLQLLFAGKAHPLDDGAKGIVQQMFALKAAPQVVGRVTFLEDYDLSIAPILVAGVDVWVNVPRPPMEASGTSGMKAALNGVLNLSVLDGWWAEAYDGANGWAIDGDVDPDEGAQDQRHSQALYDRLELDVKPLFYTRDEAGVPRGWVARMKDSLATVGPRFSANRMLDDYARDIWPPR